MADISGSVKLDSGDDVDVEEISNDGDEPEVFEQSSPAVELPKEITPLTESLGTFEAIFVDTGYKIVKKTPVKNLWSELSSVAPESKINGLVFDGVITQRLIDLGSEKQLNYIVGTKIAELVKVPANGLQVFEFSR